ncbi:MAG: biopolymer transporter ExbD [Candidatus Limisoma sp.]|nr:biopolymer transporter ExbD [Bacteroidales bacterium]MDY5899829.1 biopolymer transporter ExbD [Candidatus Limisoma sp.]MDY5999274.1 biopolymer transporter ExbD [Candidatus Limisoma sp.]MDY6105401.1 biopolymer transporter ExbD [Candidatus Limisoma sp.]
MGKVEVKKKSPFIDMTAMSDVTVLLLTFFMLTSTFLQKEPVTVITPSSVSEEKVPEQNLITVLVNPQGKVFISLAGDKDSTFSSEKMRVELVKSVVAEYNKVHPNANLSLNQKQVNNFGSTYMFGLPIKMLPKWLDMSQEQRDELIDPNKSEAAGIPIDMNEDLSKPNDFQIWMRAAYNLSNDNLQGAIKDGKGIAIKADQTTPYSVVQVVMDNLQTMKMNKFTLMTALKTEGD